MTFEQAEMLIQQGATAAEYYQAIMQLVLWIAGLGTAALIVAVIEGGRWRGHR